jgi:hypothetical protein
VIYKTSGEYISRVCAAMVDPSTNRHGFRNARYLTPLMLWSGVFAEYGAFKPKLPTKQARPYVLKDTGRGRARDSRIRNCYSAPCLI